MKLTYFAALAILSAAISGCVTTPRMAQDNLRNQVVQQAMAIVAEFTAYSEKHGEQAAIDESLKAVKRSLKDPDSAKFDGVKVVSAPNGKVLCGFVNGKNSYGGYVGFKRFVASPHGTDLHSNDSRYPDIDRAANAGIDYACGY